MDLQSMDSGGFTLVIDDAFPESIIVSYFAVGGSDVANVVSGQFQEPASTGDQDITDVGFEPSGVIFFGVNNTSAPNATGVDSHSFIGAASGPSNQGVLAGGSDDGSANSAVFLAPMAAEDVLGTIVTPQQYSIGGANSPSSRGAQFISDRHNQASSINYTGIEYDEVYINVIASSGAITGLMDLVSFDTNGMTLVMDDADPGIRFFWYMAFGPAKSLPPFQNRNYLWNRSS
jgi:hypothetical protein